MQVNQRTYKCFPFCQKIALKISDAMIKNMKRVKLYSGLLQYDKCCFHKHAIYCTLPLCGKRVGKCKSFEPGGGSLNWFTNSMVSLQAKEQYKDQDLVITRNEIPIRKLFTL